MRQVVGKNKRKTENTNTKMVQKQAKGRSKKSRSKERGKARTMRGKRHRKGKRAEETIQERKESRRNDKGSKEARKQDAESKRRRSAYQPHARKSGNHVDTVIGQDETNGRIGRGETHIFEKSSSVVQNDVDARPLLEELEHNWKKKR